MPTLRRLFYLSRASSGLSKSDVQQILQISQRHNRRSDVTGCLLYSGRHFAQVLEVNTDALNLLVGRINQDERHDALVIVMDEQIQTRRFPDWSMGVLYKEDVDDHIAQLLALSAPPEHLVTQLFDAVNPDSVMGALT